MLNGHLSNAVDHYESSGLSINDQSINQVSEVSLEIPRLSDESSKDSNWLFNDSLIGDVLDEVSEELNDTKRLVL